MENILKIIKEQRERTGLTIRHNIFNFGECSVVDSEGVTLHKGDALTCQMFINEYDALIKGDNSKQTPP